MSSTPESERSPVAAVAIYRVDLNPRPATIARLWRILSAEERARADRLRYDRGPERFIAGRGALRILLGNALGIAPEAVRLRARPNGKPELEGASDSDLRFNLSHSGDLAAIAVAFGREVGIDLERLRPLDYDGLAERFFAERERSELKRLPADRRMLGFFNCWTRKEAYLKATGEGLSFPLDRFVVSLIPDEAARLIEVVDRPDETKRWSLHALDFGPDHAAALVAEGSNVEARREPFDFERVS